MAIVPGRIRLANWINERERIRIAKENGWPKPWTHDRILQQYKFCNVHREDDTVTRWINENWRMPYANHPNLWFAMCLARQINWPGTLEEIGFPEVWHPERVIQQMLNREKRGEKVWTGAYMIRGNVQAGGKKPVWVIGNMDDLYRSGDEPRPGDTLESYHARLVEHPGWGSFLAAQAVADLKHTRWLSHALDWHRWAAWGPGSNRGLNRYFGHDLTHLYRQDAFLVALNIVRAETQPLLLEHVGPMCMQDWQNCMCEFDKYERARLGEGRPRSTYPGA